jgi:glucosamine--fructose-6-phosphate aminotransferase (isomerizing)
LKEIAYVHAEGYAAGELKHGPIAMLEPDFAVVVVAPQDHWLEKSISNLEEVKARKSKVLSIGASKAGNWNISLPLSAWDEALSPFFTIPVLQLLSYRIALLKGTDVDQPRNLAKSVTVE